MAGREANEPAGYSFFEHDHNSFTSLRVLMATATEGNSLGLEFNDKEPAPPTLSAQDQVDESPATETAEKDEELRDSQKKRPYVNPDRFKTGGSQRASSSIPTVAVFAKTNICSVGQVDRRGII